MSPITVSIQSISCTYSTQFTSIYMFTNNYQNKMENIKTCYLATVHSNTLSCHCILREKTDHQKIQIGFVNASHDTSVKIGSL